MTPKKRGQKKSLNRFLCVTLAIALTAGILAPLTAFAQTPPPTSPPAQTPPPTSPPGGFTGSTDPSGFILNPNENKTKSRDCGWDFACIIIDAVGSLLISISLAAINLGGKIVQFAAEAISTVFEITKQIFKLEIVKKGFESSLDVANLGFVLALILIAFATMLRISEYGIKSLLPKLIIAVLLVNFSFAIAGIFIDFSHTVSAFFLSQGGPPSTIGSRIMDGIGLQQLLQPTGQTTKTLQPIYEYYGFSGVVKLLVITIIILLFVALTAIVMGAIAIMVLIRLVALCILLILMPLAWLFMVTPRFTNIWSKWWEKFLNWIFFLPAVTFFIFLVVTTAPDIKNKIGDNLSGTATGLDNAVGITNFTSIAMRIVIVFGLLVGGLIVAQGMGIGGARMGMAAAGGLKNRLVAGARGAGRLGVRGAAGGARLAGGAALGAAGALSGRALLKGGARVLSNVAGSRVARWIPGAKRFSNVLAGAGARKNEVENYREKNLSGLTKEQKIATTNKGYLPANNAGKAALLEEAIAGNYIGDINPKKLKKMIIAARKMGSPAAKEIQKYDPRFAFNGADKKSRKEYVAKSRAELGIGPEKKLDKSQKQAVLKQAEGLATRDATRKNDSRLFTKDALSDVNVVVNMNNAKISTTASLGDDRLREALMSSIASLKTIKANNTPFYQKFTKDIDRIIDYEAANPGLQMKGIGGPSSITSGGATGGTSAGGAKTP